MAGSSVGSVTIFVLCFTSTAFHLSSAQYGHCNGQKPWGFEVKNVTTERTLVGSRVRLFLEGTKFPRAAAYGVNRRDFTADTLMYPEFFQPKEPVPVTLSPTGLVEFSVITRFQQVLVSLQHPCGMHYILLQFNGSTTSSAVVPHLDFTLQGKTTFHKGNVTHLNFSCLLTDDQSTIQRAYFAGLNLYSRSELEENAVERETVKANFDTSSKAEKHALLRINTASGHTEGLLNIKTVIAFNCEPDCFLKGYTIHEQVLIYQKHHAGPFCRQFAGVPRVKYHAQGHKKHCLYDSPCQVHCEFFGHHPSNVQLVGTGPEADLRPPTLVSSATTDHWAEGMFSTADRKAGVVEDYQCKAQTGSKTVVFNVSLIYVQPLVLDEKASTSTRLQNGTWVFTCYATGIPVPRIQFYDGDPAFDTPKPLDDDNSDAYDVKMMQSDDNSTTRVLRIYDMKVITNWNAVCRATQGLRDEDSYFLGYSHVYST